MAQYYKFAQTTEPVPVPVPVPVPLEKVDVATVDKIDMAPFGKVDVATVEKVDMATEPVVEPVPADKGPMATEPEQALVSEPVLQLEQMGGTAEAEAYTNYAPADFTQTGGDGFRLGVDAEMVGGQAVVEGYDNEQATCGGYGEDLQVGGGSPFNFITDPDTNQSLSIFSGAGKALLKSYVKAYKQMQSGGAALLEGVDTNATGALYDGVQNAGAENMPDACGLTYDAQGDNWTHTQVGGGDDDKAGQGDFCGYGVECKDGLECTADTSDGYSNTTCQ